MSRKALESMLLCALLSCTALLARASAQHQAPQLDSAGIQHRLAKLEVLAGVLYIAAHPDDENTRLISYLANGRRVRAGYLSLTRGDGGQNLIGPEFGEGLGIIRTQELLEARRIDGGEQLFTRASDFGYSKSPEEAFAKWGRTEILGDVVRAIRSFRPDVIVTRFDIDGSGGHGHHTASALLAREAFLLAADPRAYPEQLTEGLAPWRTGRLFFNGSTWWRADLAQVAERDPQHWLAVDVGGFEPLLGASFNEIAGRSRSLHKSQGFGSAETRGELLEYLRLELGPRLGTRDLLDGVDCGWSRLEGGAEIAADIRGLRETFDPERPEASFDGLCRLAARLETFAAESGAEGAHWGRHQLRAVQELIAQCCGLVVEVTGPRARVAPGERWKLETSVLQRRTGPRLRWRELRGPQGSRAELDLELTPNRAAQHSVELTLEGDVPFDQPHWLAEGPRRDVLAPTVAGALATQVRFELPGGGSLVVDAPVSFKWVDPVAGERLRRVVVTPAASIAATDDVVLVQADRASLAVDVEALREGLHGQLEVQLPAGWKLARAPGSVPRDAPLAKGEKRRFLVELEHTQGARSGLAKLAFVAEDGAVLARHRLREIDQDHLLPQTWYTPAEVRLVPLDVKVTSRRVGYVRGAGDEVPRALERLGVQVEFIDPARADTALLAGLDAVVIGVRAYNTLNALAQFHGELLEFVRGGGTLVVQYNTPGATLVVPADKLGPAPFQLTRNRVTVEEAAPTFVDPLHGLLTTPNVLGPLDFAGWVQERGLYFAGDFGERYAAPIAWSDPGEEPQRGGLIACDLGAGRFLYTGISLFRQLPAGVPGAYRLLANLIARRTPRN
jgi:LmbE family N-acetylglucosaminyl deacetylase